VLSGADVTLSLTNETLDTKSIGPEFEDLPDVIFYKQCKFIGQFQKRWHTLIKSIP